MALLKATILAQILILLQRKNLRSITIERFRVTFSGGIAEYPANGISLEPEEILQIITDVSNALTPSVKEALEVQAQSVAAVDTQQEIERNAKIVELESVIAQLQNAKPS